MVRIFWNWWIIWKFGFIKNEFLNIININYLYLEVCYFNVGKVFRDRLGYFFCFKNKKI